MDKTINEFNQIYDDINGIYGFEDIRIAEIACKIQRNRIEQDKLNAFKEAFVLGHGGPGALEKAIMVLEEKM